MQQGWMQLELVSLGSDGGCGLLPQGCSTAQFGGSAAAAAAAAEEQEVMDFLNSSANGSTQVCLHDWFNQLTHGAMQASRASFSSRHSAT
jgi:hypothetical protein